MNQTTARSPRPSLSLDLTNLPPLTTPTPPTNTLLITDLQDLTLFQPDSLSHIRSQISQTAPLNSFSPLPSFRRIVCSFHNESDALLIRKQLGAQPGLAGCGHHAVRPRIYFGEPTPILDDEEARPKLLEAPHADKLFFISPPPSPPHGWVMRNEDPPNKEVHASDLANALASLKTEQSGFGNESGNASGRYANDPDTPVSMTSNRTASWNVSGQRSRSSTLIYHPGDHGMSPNLPAVLVEDMSGTAAVDGDVDMSPIEMQSQDQGLGNVQKLPPKTARPPVELMEC